MTTPHPTLAQLDAEIAGARQAFTTFYLYGPAEQAQVLGIAGTSVPRAAQAAAAAGVGTVAFAMVQQELAAARAAQAPMPWLEILDAALTAAGQAPTPLPFVGSEAGIPVTPTAPGRRRTVVIAAVAAVALAAAGGVTFALTRPESAPQSVADPQPTTTAPATPSHAPTPTPTPEPTPEPTTEAPRAQWVDARNVRLQGDARMVELEDLFDDPTTSLGDVAIVSHDSEDGSTYLLDLGRAEHDGVQDLQTVPAPTVPDGSPEGTSLHTLSSALVGSPEAPLLARTSLVRFPARDLTPSSEETFLEVYDIRAGEVRFSRSLADDLVEPDAAPVLHGTESTLIVVDPVGLSDLPVMFSISLDDGATLWDRPGEPLATTPTTVLVDGCPLLGLDASTGKETSRYTPQVDECRVGTAYRAGAYLVFVTDGSEYESHVFDARSMKLLTRLTHNSSHHDGYIFFDPVQPYMVATEAASEDQFQVVDLRDDSVVLGVSADDVYALTLRFVAIYDGKIWLKQTDESFVRDLATNERVADPSPGSPPAVVTDTGWILDTSHEDSPRLVRPEARAAVD